MFVDVFGVVWGTFRVSGGGVIDIEFIKLGDLRECNAGRGGILGTKHRSKVNGMVPIFCVDLIHDAGESIKFFLFFKQRQCGAFQIGEIDKFNCNFERAATRAFCPSIAECSYHGERVAAGTKRNAHLPAGIIQIINLNP